MGTMILLRKIYFSFAFLSSISLMMAIGTPISVHNGVKHVGEEFIDESTGKTSSSDVNHDFGIRNLGKIDLVIDGKWQQFRHWSAGSQALTCGTSCIPGVNSEYAPPAPWTFTLPRGGGCLIVVDAFEMIDQFNVTDFGNITIGTTSKPRGTGKCGKYPDFCYEAPGVSKGSFYLQEGPHSAMIIVAQGGAGSAFFRVTTNTSLCASELSAAPTTPGPTTPVMVIKSPAPTLSPVENNASRNPADSTSDSASPTSTPTAPSGLTNRPPIAKCKESVTLPARKDCATRVSINEGSYDPDDGDTMTMKQRPWGPYPLGTTNVTLIVTDSAGESDSCFTQVTIIDMEEINGDNIDCGISDWHVQPCDGPLTIKASYNVPLAPKPNIKTNGCPVKMVVSSDSAAFACERCVGQASSSQIVELNCRRAISITDDSVTLRQSKTYGFFMSWQLVVKDGRGRLVTKRCGVCMENPDPSGCPGANSTNRQQGNLKRHLARVYKCPADLPSSTDGTLVWPAQRLAEIDNCEALFENQ